VSKSIQQLLNKLIKMRGEEDLLRKQLKDTKIDEKKILSEISNIEKAKIIAQEVSKATQDKVTYHINGLVTSGLEAVFPDPYTFNLKFVTRRNKTEADLVFIKNGNETTDILNSGGGGVADITSYLLSIAVFSVNPSRPILVRDENFKFLHSVAFQKKASIMIKKISEKFGIQMVLISDQPALYSCADKVIMTKINKGVSSIGYDEKEEEL